MCQRVAHWSRQSGRPLHLLRRPRVLAHGGRYDVGVDGAAGVARHVHAGGTHQLLYVVVQQIRHSHIV